MYFLLALRDLRRWLGPAPLKALFEVVAGPLACDLTAGTPPADLAPYRLKVGGTPTARGRCRSRLVP